VGDATWQERPTSNTQETIIIDPQKTYEVAVASRDAACNQSAFATANSAAPSPIIVLATVKPENTTTTTTASKEAHVLYASLAKTGTKDGELGSQSAESARKSGNVASNGNNGLAQTNGQTPGVSSPNPEASKPPASESKNPFKSLKNTIPTIRTLLKNRSSWVFALAILLIVLGAGLALYSGLRGGTEDSVEDVDDAQADSTIITPEDTEAESKVSPPDEDSSHQAEPPKQNSRRRKRKTRW